MKTIALLLLAFSLVTVLPATSQDAKYWLAQTQNDYNNGTYLMALDDIDEYLAINSSDLWAWNFKANLLIKMKRYSDAVDSFDRIIQLDSTNAKAYNDRALILSGRMRQDEEALNSLDTALQIEPNNANTWFNKGMILEKVNRNSEALEAYGKATTLDPSLDRAWYRQGHVLMLTENYEEALQSLEKAKELNPNNSEALNDIGLVQTELNSANDDPNSVDNANMAAGAMETVPEETIEFPVAGEAAVQ